MARDGWDQDERPDSIVVLLFCACMRRGESGLSSRRVTWRIGEYDVLDTEQTYVEIARHRGACELQPDMFETPTKAGPA